MSAADADTWLPDAALIPTSVTCPRCTARVDVAHAWDLVQCPCGKVLWLMPWMKK